MSTWEWSMCYNNDRKGSSMCEAGQITFTDLLTLLAGGRCGWVWSNSSNFSSCFTGSVHLHVKILATLPFSGSAYKRSQYVHSKQNTNFDMGLSMSITLFSKVTKVRLLFIIMNKEGDIKIINNSLIEKNFKELNDEKNFGGLDSRRKYM